MIFLQLSQQLQSLRNLLISLTEEQYVYKAGYLGNASIGGHTRHIIELLQCAVKGYQSGTVDYINRQRDLRLEADKTFAVTLLHELESHIHLADKQLKMQADELNDEQSAPAVTTTWFREIVYNTEHTIHHLALIKVALIEMQLNVVDMQFGMACSTIKYKASLAGA